MPGFAEIIAVGLAIAFAGSWLVIHLFV